MFLAWEAKIHRHCSKLRQSQAASRAGRKMPSSLLLPGSLETGLDTLNGSRAVRQHVNFRIVYFPEASGLFLF